MNLLKYSKYWKEYTVSNYNPDRSTAIWTLFSTSKMQDITDHALNHNSECFYLRPGVVSHMILGSSWSFWNLWDYPLWWFLSFYIHWLLKSQPALLHAHSSENPQYSTKIIIVLGVSIIHKHTKNNLSLPNHASQCQQTFYLVKDNVRSLFIPLTPQLVNIHPPHCG